MDENKTNELPEQEEAEVVETAVENAPAQEAAEEAVETAAETIEEAAESVEEAAETAAEAATETAEKTAEAAPEKEGKKGITGLAIGIIALVAVIAIIIGVKSSKASAPIPEAPAATEAAATAAPETETPASSTDVDTSAADAEAAAAAYKEKYDRGYAKHDPSDVVLTINGQEVTWGEYYYWLSGVTYALESQYGITDWTQEIGDGYTFNDYARDYVASYLSQIDITFQWAEEEGITLTDDQKAQLQTQYESDVATYGNGDEAAFAEYLMTNSYITTDLYDKVNEVYILMQNIFNDHFGENGSKVPDEDVLAMASDSGYLNCKHILIKFDSEAADAEADKAEKMAKAQDLLDKINASGLKEADLEELFTTLMNENSDDAGGLASCPDGYLFTSGTMVAEFENATAALSDYEVSDLVESSYGYHIILRLPITPESVPYGSQTSLRTNVADTLFSDQLYERVDAAEIVYQGEFENLDITDVFA